MKGIPGSPRSSHGLSKTKEHQCWISMRCRCNNKDDERYPDYGGQGIRVHPEWDKPWNGGFEAFLAYMGKCPPDKNSIDRWPNQKGNYEPGNVRWGNDEDQNNNKRTNHLLTHNGKTQSLAQWGRELGISRITIRSRLREGWPVELALTPGNFKGRGGAKRALTSQSAAPTLPLD